MWSWGKTHRAGERWYEWAQFHQSMTGVKICVGRGVRFLHIRTYKGKMIIESQARGRDVSWVAMHPFSHSVSGVTVTEIILCSSPLGARTRDLPAHASVWHGRHSHHDTVELKFQVNSSALQIATDHHNNRVQNQTGKALLQRQIEMVSKVDLPLGHQKWAYHYAIRAIWGSRR